MRTAACWNLVIIFDSCFGLWLCVKYESPACSVLALLLCELDAPVCSVYPSREFGSPSDAAVCKIAHVILALHGWRVWQRVSSIPQNTKVCFWVFTLLFAVSARCSPLTPGHGLLPEFVIIHVFHRRLTEYQRLDERPATARTNRQIQAMGVVMVGWLNTGEGEAAWRAIPDDMPQSRPPRTRPAQPCTSTASCRGQLLGAGHLPFPHRFSFDADMW